MKKTLTVNLNGRVYTIDEDAYRLLDNYLNNLRIHFRKEEGSSEIINDFEARIEELFSEKIRAGYQVITLEHVEEIIARVGKPADFATNDENEQGKAQFAEKVKEFAEKVKTKKKFYRNVNDKVLGGVCSGIAAYFDWNVAIVRIIFVVLPFLPLFGWWIVPAYIIAWIFFPAAHTVEQQLQMKGEPITVENIGKTVAAQSVPEYHKKPRGFWSGLFIGLGCLIALPLALPLLLVLFVLVVVLFALIIAFFAVLFGVGGGLAGVMPLHLVAEHPVLTAITGIITLGIPIFALIYSFISYAFKLRPMYQPVKSLLIIIWIVALFVFLFSGFKLKENINADNWFNKWDIFHISDFPVIRGNNIPTQKTINFDEVVTQVELGKYLHTTIQIEQTQDEMPSIEIRGDENLVEQVKYELHNGRLVLTAHNRLHSSDNLTITLRTGELNSLKMNSVGNVRMKHVFTGNVFDVRLEGVGNFDADSLYVNSLTVRTEGVGSANIVGKVEKVRLETAGVGKIDAMDLLSDTVYAKVDGVGSIQCNPVEYFEGRTHGVGSITYKSEPKNKDIRSFGIGKIKKR